MDIVKLLKGVELFEGLTGEQLARLGALCAGTTFQKGEVIFAQGQPGDKMGIVRDGFVEVIVGPEGSESGLAPRTVVNLGTGQVFGEMSLVDGGARSATVRAVTDNTVVDMIEREAFTQLCESDTDIGYVVMRNMSADLSFKLRHRHLSRR